MNPVRTQRIAARLSLAAVAALLGSVIASPALAQGQSVGPRSGGLRFRSSAPQLGGVKSQAPRPQSGLGGVRMGFPQTNKPVMRGSPESAFKPMRVGPFPGVVNTPTPRTTVSPGFDPRLSPRFQGRDFQDGRFRGDGFRNGRFGNGFVSGSGVNINGAFDDDNFRLRFHIGGPTEKLIPRHSRHSLFGHDFHHNVVFVPGFIDGRANWWYDDYSYVNYGNRYPLIQGIYPEAQPQPETQPEYQPQPAAPANNKELGDLYLLAGDSKSAAAAYRIFLGENPDDSEAMRGLGLALLDLNQVKEAAAMIGMAYRTSPTLAYNRVARDAFGGDPAMLRENLRRVSVYANQSNSAAAWLTLAVLMQAEGRNAVARSMIERARGAGLEESVVRMMQTALVS